MFRLSEWALWFWRRTRKTERIKSHRRILDGIVSITECFFGKVSMVDVFYGTGWSYFSGRIGRAPKNVIVLEAYLGGASFSEIFNINIFNIKMF